jgi:hypothetical protein
MPLFNLEYLLKFVINRLALMPHVILLLSVYCFGIQLTNNNEHRRRTGVNGGASFDTITLFPNICFLFPLLLLFYKGK